MTTREGFLRQTVVDRTVSYLLDAVEKPDLYSGSPRWVQRDAPWIDEVRARLEELKEWNPRDWVAEGAIRLLDRALQTA